MTAIRPGPRERLIDAARELTYTQGVQVGVDAILKRADVARRSLYQHFGGKDGLIAEMLKTTSYVSRYRDTMDQAGDDPRSRILAVFDELEKVTTRPTFRGCRYTAAEVGLSDPEHPAHAQVYAYKDALHRLFTDEMTKLGHPNPPAGADQILVLVDGVFAHAVTRPEAHPALAARSIAELLLDQVPRP